MIPSISSTDTTWSSQQIMRPDNDGDGDDRKVRFDKALSGAAQLLGMSVDELHQAQRDGQSLSDLAKTKGVSTDDLIKSIAQGLQENAPANATNAASSPDFTKMATDIVNRTGGPGGARGHHHHHHNKGQGVNSANSDLSSLLSQSGIDPTQLSSILSGSQSEGSDADTTSSNGDFVAQLKTLLAQYGSKGLSYDTKL